jgi:hypothetical protein
MGLIICAQSCLKADLVAEVAGSQSTTHMSFAQLRLDGAHPDEVASREILTASPTSETNQDAAIAPWLDEPVRFVFSHMYLVSHHLIYP